LSVLGLACLERSYSGPSSPRRFQTPTFFTLPFLFSEVYNFAQPRFSDCALVRSIGCTEMVVIREMGARPFKETRPRSRFLSRVTGRAMS
jgi:hypothetical protein